MTHPIDAQELMSRIIRARDFASRRQEELDDLAARGLSPDGTASVEGATGSVICSTAFGAVRAVLDEIIDPEKPHPEAVAPETD